MVFAVSSYLEELAKNIIVDKEIKELINREDRDFRICTSCSGPVLIPTDFVPPKSNDIKIHIGEHILFLSLIQARFTRRIHKSLVDQYYWILEKGLDCQVD